MTLLAHYKLDDNAANTTVTAQVGVNGSVVVGGDTSALAVGAGNGPGGSLANAGFSFDGVDDYVSCPDPKNGSDSFLGGNAFTVAFWIYRRTNTGTRVPVGNYGKTASWYVHMFTSGGTQLRSDHGGDRIVHMVPNGAYLNDAWWHFAFTRVNGTKFDSYLNGELLDHTLTGDLNYALAPTFDDPFYIGAQEWNGVAYNNINASIADVRIYDSDESSNLDSIINDARPTFSVSPTIIGDGEIGSSHSVSWTAANAESVTAEYWWYAADDMAGLNETLVGTSSTYTPVVGDKGKYLRCDMRLTNVGGAGLQSTTVASTYVGAIGVPRIVGVATSYVESGGTTVAYSWSIPPHQAGDILIAFAKRYNGDPIVPSGWTLLQSPTNYSARNFSIFYKVGDGVQTTQFDQTANWQSKDHTVLAIRGAAEFPGAWSGEYTASWFLESYGISYPQITVASDNSLLLHTAYSPNAKAPGAVSTARRWIMFTSSTKGVWHKYAPAAAGTSPAFYTGGLDNWRYWRTGTFAIAPAPSSGTDHLTANSLASGTPVLGTPAVSEVQSQQWTSTATLAQGSAPAPTVETAPTVIACAPSSAAAIAIAPSVQTAATLVTAGVGLAQSSSTTPTVQTAGPLIAAGAGLAQSNAVGPAVQTAAASTSAGAALAQGAALAPTIQAGAPVIVAGAALSQASAVVLLVDSGGAVTAGGVAGGQAAATAPQLATAPPALAAGVGSVEAMAAAPASQTAPTAIVAAPAAAQATAASPIADSGGPLIAAAAAAAAASSPAPDAAIAAAVWPSSVASAAAGAATPQVQTAPPILAAGIAAVVAAALSANLTSGLVATPAAAAAAAAADAPPISIAGLLAPAVRTHAVAPRSRMHVVAAVRRVV